MGVGKQRKKEFLEAIVRNGKKANVTELRAETGWSRNQVDYWFPKLVDENLIEKQYDDNDRRVATLTDRGRTEIKKGDYGGELVKVEEQGSDEITLSKSEFESLNERAEKLEQQNQALREQVRELKNRQNFALQKVGKLRIMVEGFRRLFEDDYNIPKTMDDVEMEAMEANDLDPDILQYAKKE